MRAPSRRTSRRNPPPPSEIGEFVAPRTFYRWLESRDFKLTPEEYVTYERVRDAANDLQRALDRFMRDYAGDSRVLSREEDAAIGAVMRIMMLAVVPESSVEIVEKKRPRYPGQRP